MMHVYISRINPTRPFLYTAMLRRAGSVSKETTKTTEKYPDLEQFLTEHFSPRYKVVRENHGNDRFVQIGIDLFDTSEIPEAFTYKNGTMSITRDHAISCIVKRIDEILSETNHKDMIRETSSRYIGNRSTDSAVSSLCIQITILLKESLQVRHGSMKRTIMDFINYIDDAA